MKKPNKLVYLLLTLVGCLLGYSNAFLSQTFIPTNVLTVANASNLSDLGVGDLQTASSNKEIVLANSGNYNNINPNNFLPLISLNGMTLTQSNISYNGYNANSIAVGDFNSDGYLDITHSSDCNCSNAYIRQGSAAGTFTNATVTSSFFMQRFTNDIAVGNLLNNGRVSIASGGNALTEIKTNTGTGTNFTFTNVGTSALNTGNPANSSWGFNIGDINGDGLGDIIAAYPTVGSVYIYYNTGTSPYFNTTNIQTINMTNNGIWDNVQGIATGDVDADGDIDIAAVVRTDGSGGRAFYVITNNGSGSFSVSSPVSIASYCTWIEMGDLSGDGRADIVIPGNGTVKVYNSNNGTFSSTASYTYNFNAKRVAISDINGDGDLDIAAISSNQVVVLIQGTTFVEANPNVFSNFTGCLGGTSPNQSTLVFGGGLSSAVTVTAPSGFQVSTNPNSGFASSLTLPQSGGVVTTTVYVRILPAALGSLSGNLTVSATGATTVTIPLTGNVFSAPTVGAGANQTVCSGTQVTLSGSGASSYVWNNGVSDGVGFTPNTTQNYIVTGTDANGCSDTAQVTVTVNSPAVSGGSNQAICIGANVTLSGSGASTYSWDNGVQNGIAFTPNTTQTYTVTGTDANGCQGTSQVTVTVNALPSVGAGNSQTVCAGTSVTLNGTGAATYSWDNNVQNGVAFNANASTTYTVTGTDANGCVNTAQVQITVDPVPSVSAGSNQSVCSGSQVSLSGSGALTYAWNNGVTDGVPFTVNNTQTYTVTGTAANGCTNSAQVTVTAISPNVSGGSNQAICLGSSVTLSGSGAATYTWNNGVQDGVAFSPNTTQTYTVTGTDANGCQNTAQVVVTVNSIPNVGAGQNQTLCAGSPVTLNGTGAVTYSWDNGIQDGVSFNANSTTTYTVTGTDGNGCQNTAQITLNVNPLPNVSAGQNQTICQGNAAILMASGASSYAWTNAVQNGVAFIPSTTQTYTVTGTDGNGCQSTAQVTITVNTPPSITLTGGTNVCANGSVAMNASTSGAFGGFWSINNGNGSITPNLSSSAINYSANANDPASVSFVYVAFNQCGSSNQTISVNVLPIPSINAGSNVNACVGSSTSLTATSSGAVVWNGGIQNGTPFTVASGSTQYIASTTAGNGCSNSDTVTVTGLALPTVGAGSNQTVCAGTSVTLTGTGASTYTWNNNVQNAVAFIPNVTTTYTVTGTAANGCTNTAQTTVTVNVLPTVSAGQNQAVCAGTAVTLSGTGASTYAWNNGVTNAVAFTPNATTTYTVTGTAANGCTNTAQTTVTVNALPTVSAGSNQTVCAGTAVTLSGTGASTYAWNNGVTNAVAFTPNATTTYTVTGTDANGCTNTAQTTVTVNALPTVNAGQNQTVCAGTAVTLSGSGASTYAWNNGVTNAVAFTPIATTTYTVTGTDANGCINTAQVTVTVNALPNVSGGQNQAVCTGNTVTLSGSGAQSYTWNNNVQNGVAFTPNATTTYTVTGTDANGCTNTAQVQIAVNALPTVSAGQNQTVCAGTSVTLNGSGAQSYTWNNNVQDGVAFIPNANTTYTVTGTDANGCTNTAQVQVTVNALPTVSAGQNQAVCAGTSVTLNGSGANTYTWNNNVQDGVAFTPSTTQSYAVIGTDANGCTNTSQVTVTVNALPIVSGGQNQAVCAGNSTILNGSGAQSYFWSNGIQDGVPFIPTVSQNYTVTGIDANGCVSSATVTITVNALPVVSANYPLSVCQGMPVVLIGSGATTYTWNNGVQNGIAFIPTITQSYTVTGTDANGCTDTDQITVAVNPYPVVSAGQNQTVCNGTQITLSASGAGSYTWNNGVQNGVPFTVTTTQTYTVIGSNNGCTDTAQVTVTVNPLPAVSAGSNQSVCSGSAVTLAGSGATSYTWNNNVQNGVAFTPNTTQTYTVTGTDANGCTNTAQVTVQVNTLPQVSAGNNQVVCSGSSTVLSGSGALTYIWNNNVQDGISFVPNATQTYTVTGTDVNGCQASSQVTVSVVNSTASTLNEVACNEFTLNGQTYTQTGTYTQTLGNAAGCDSILTLNLTINNSPAVPVINVTNNTELTIASEANATYQWILCNSGLSIANETDTVYNPTVNGIYAVEVTNGCGTVTSECVTINNMGVDVLNNAFSVYPNPTHDLITIVGLSGQSTYFEVQDLMGRKVKNGIFTAVNETLDLSLLTTGQYYLVVEGYTQMNIIKQ